MSFRSRLREVNAQPVKQSNHIRSAMAYNFLSRRTGMTAAAIAKQPPLT
jgi:hypothetical protein